MLEQMKNRISGSIILWLILVTSGCQTASRQQKFACDFVIDPDISEASIQSPTLEKASQSEPASLMPLFVSIELGEYENVPNPCRPCTKEPIAQVEWRPKRRPVPAGSEKKTHSGSQHIASVRTSTAPAPTPAPPPETVATEATAPDNCLPMLTEWKDQIDSKSLAFESEIVDLRKTLILNQKLIFKMEQSLTRANVKIESMTTDLTYYRKEVGRLETLMEQQHSEDILVLDELSKQLGNLLGTVSK